MTCQGANPFVDAIAAGEEVAEAVRSHVAACPRCETALANARAIEAALRNVEPAAVPAHFATSVVARVRRDRWRSEQILDWTFNVAIAVGVLLIVGGIAGVAWAAGFAAIGADLLTLALAGAEQVAGRAVQDAPTIAVAAALLTMTVGLWWWAEADITL